MPVTRLPGLPRILRLLALASVAAPTFACSAFAATTPPAPVTAPAHVPPTFTIPLPTLPASARGEMFQNPVIPGFSPDPSIVRVGEDFYLVCSTFEYFPGVPIYHSRDLVNWQLIGHCLARPEQLPLGTCGPSSGIYAPTLRHHDGVFYMITTNYASKGVFYVTATDPRGPWSDPVWLGNTNVDPSLLFDDDGKTYLVHPDGGRYGLIYLMEMDMARGRYAEGQTLPGKFLWAGTGGEYPEGPHLYKINGYYYLMIAEGGTGQQHRQTIARSKSPWGPFWPWENNPILTHRDDHANPISATGHADLVQLADGSWWSVFLGIRPQNGQSHLGRETFLAPVEWTRDAKDSFYDAWPVIGGDRRAHLSGPGPALPRHPFPPAPVRDEFDAPAPGLEWVYLRNPVVENYSLSERPGWLRLQGSAVTLDERASPAALLRRQRHFDLALATRIDFSPTRDGDEAGLTLRLNEALHAELCLRRVDGVTRLLLRRTDRTEKIILHDDALPAATTGPLELHVTADRDTFTFAYVLPDGTRHPAGAVATADLAVEASWQRGITCFTGLMVGVYATGNGQPASAPADFAWFDYRPANP